MSLVWTIYKKDVKSFFSSPLFYAIAGLCALIWSPIYVYAFGMFLSQLATVMGAGSETISYHERVLVEFASLVNFMLLLFGSGITMKLIAEEKKNHTYELLLTSPLTSWQITLAKYFSGLTVMVALLAISLLYPISTAFLGKIYWAPVVSIYAGLFLFSAVYVALGLLGSALSSSVIMAFMISLILNLGLWFLGVGVELSSSQVMTRFFETINLEPIFKEFSMGVIRLSSVMYLLSLSILGVLFSERVIESTRWR